MESIPSSANVECRLTVFRSRIPRILLTHSTMLPDPPLPARFSATTMLATTGHDCFMKLFSTIRHEDIF
ncbi:hypothetical protein L798_06625 [Zootermopsis nevadensis]|uniref:Uncharacterized protein n=1 Tax=Zootermopsis nevadensis TaxID=136037 RepID=A0A067RF00_ZOONE|nr:hypothetical protein L798_06625 [Zootermopsis nevadensis]